MPAISVIIPTRNRNHLLPRSLGSLLSQTFQDIEILVVDDNAVDKRILKNPALESLLANPKIRVLEHDSPKNASAARNFGLEAAQGEWIGLLDDDDAYEPQKLEFQWRRARETKLPIGLCGVTYNLRNRRRLRGNSQWLIPRREMLLAPCCPASVFFHNDGCVRYDETLFAGEDAHFLFRLIHHFDVGAVFNVPESLIQVYPQVGQRVNVNAEALFQTNMAIYRDFANYYGDKAANVFLAHAQLQDAKFRGGYLTTVRRALDVVRCGGFCEWRLVANTFLYKIPFTRPFVVS